jgi:hypothetical protein
MIEENCDGRIHILDKDYAYIAIKLREGETHSSEAHEFIFLKKYARYLVDNCGINFLVDILAHLCSDRISAVKETFEDSFKVTITNPDPPLKEFGIISFKFKRFENDNL